MPRPTSESIKVTPPSCVAVAWTVDKPKPAASGGATSGEDPKAIYKEIQSKFRGSGRAENTPELVALVEEIRGLIDRLRAADPNHEKLAEFEKKADKLVVSDGKYQFEIDPVNQGLGEKFEASFESSIAHVQDELRRHHIPVLPIDTVSPVTDQLREILGGRRASQ